LTPRVSVVIPAYNNVEYIAQTMDSVLGQTFTDFELVVADHSSTDGTWELLQRYAADPRVRLTRTPPGGGAQRNWNAVSQAASGELLKLVCGDDVIYPTMLERQVAELDAQAEQVVLVASSRDLIDGQGRVFMRARGLQGFHGRLGGGAALRKIVRSGANPLGEPACVMFRRSALESAGWWDATSPYYIDAGTYARVLLVGDMAAIDEPLAAFRVSAGQWSVKLAREQHTQACEFHRRAQQLAPAAVHRRDVFLGNALARKAAWQRRLAYVWLGRRMRPVAIEPVEV
jgi:glycosyltransferase involved in cell wall biosynthesis